MAVPSFLFGGSTNETPASIKQKRDLVRALMGASNSPKNIGEGLNALGDGIVANVLDRRANEAEAKGTGAANDLFNSILGTGAPSGSSPSAAMPATTGAGEQMAATSPAPAVDISGDKQTFISSLLPAAMEESKRTGVDPRIIVAQAAQETGWGKSAPGNNFFGIKSHGQSGGQTLPTNEVIDGKTVRINDSFRQFASPQDSVKGYGDFITQNPRYKPFREAQGLDAQLQALQASGYATDPNYSRSVGAIARGVQLPNEVASATPQAAIEAAAPASGYVDPMVSAPNSRAPMTMAGNGARGLISPGNIDLANRPVVKNQDGSISTVRSMSFGEDGKEILVPTVSPDGRILSDQEAIDQYHQSGQNLGVFANPNDATAYAQTLHNQQAGMYGGNASVPPLEAPRTIAPAPQVAQVAQPQQRPAQAPQGGMFGGVDPRLLQALQNPFLNEGQKASIQLLIQQQQRAAQQQQEQQTWQAREEYKRTAEHSDPSYQLEQDYKKAQLEAIRNKTGKTNLINAGEGNIYDPDSKTWIKAPGAQGQTGDAFRFGGNSVEAQALNGLIESKQLTPMQAQSLAAGKTITGPNGEILFLTPQGVFKQPGGQAQAQTSPEVDIFAGTPMAAGAQAAPQQQAPAPTNDAIPITSPKAPSNEQLNAASFADRMNSAGQKLDQYEGQGLNGTSQFLTRSPFVPSIIGNTIVGKTNPEYQVFDQAKRDFINAQLRRESGAVIGQDEFDNADKQYFPQPGDSPEVIKQKREARKLAVESMGRSAGPTYKRPAAESDDIRMAREAIAKGADRQKVIQRLRDANIDPTGL